MTVTLFAIAIILILDNLGVNVTGLVAGLGIGGIAIGLAAQGIFSDLFAALSILFDKPFRRGDTISFDSITGTVERIGLKSTRIRSVGGEEVIVSNANLLNARLQNWTRLERRRALIVLSLVYQTPPDLLAQAARRARGDRRAPAAGEVRPRPPRQIRRLLARSRAGLLRRFAPARRFPQARQAVMLDILRRFAELDIQLAYPTQTAFTAAPDGRLIMPYPEADAT